MSIDDLIRRAGLALGCEGLEAGVTLLIPTGQVPSDGFPLGRLLTIGPAGAHVRYPATHLVIWCFSQHLPGHARAVTTRPLEPGHPAPVLTPLQESAHA